MVTKPRASGYISVITKHTHTYYLLLTTMSVQETTITQALETIKALVAEYRELNPFEEGIRISYERCPYAYFTNGSIRQVTEVSVEGIQAFRTMEKQDAHDWNELDNDWIILFAQYLKENKSAIFEGV